MAKAANAEVVALSRFQRDRGVMADVAVTAAALLTGLVAAAVARDKPELDALLDTLSASRPQLRTCVAAPAAWRCWRRSAGPRRG
jgi:hypothetical protein